jgi:hypothetical protein
MATKRVRETEMEHYVATMENTEEYFFEAPNIHEAVDIAIWEFSGRGFIVSVEPEGIEHDGEWQHVYEPDSRFDTREEAIEAGDDYEVIKIAIPVLS